MAVDPVNLRFDPVLEGEIRKLLNQHYPVVVKRGHVTEKVVDVWHVIVQDTVAIVRHRALSNTWGFKYLMTGNWKVDSRKIIYFAGELMERFNAARGEVDFEALKSLPRNIVGEAIGDHT